MAKYKSGEIDLDETRRLVDERAGGINPQAGNDDGVLALMKRFNLPLAGNNT